MGVSPKSLLLSPSWAWGPLHALPPSEAFTLQLTRFMASCWVKGFRTCHFLALWLHGPWVLLEGCRARLAQSWGQGSQERVIDSRLSSCLSGAHGRSSGTPVWEVSVPGSVSWWTSSEFRDGGEKRLLGASPPTQNTQLKVQRPNWSLCPMIHAGLGSGAGLFWGAAAEPHPKIATCYAP